MTVSGAKGSGEGSPDITKCTAAGRIGKDSYSLEIRIPCAVLGAPVPTAGTVWHATFCRNIQTTKSGGDKFTCWSPLEHRFLEPQNFGAIEFLDRTLPAAEAAKLTEDLNRGYRTSLSDELSAAARRGGEFTPALEQAAQDPRLGTRAKQLLEDWRRIEAVNQQAATAAVTDVRQALMSAGSLVQASYEVKYTFLLDRLVAE